MIDEDEDFGASPDDVPSDWNRQLLTFWFEDHGFSDWFRGGEAFDEKVRAAFSGWWHALQAQPADAFLRDAQSALAAIILFDQVPRNIFRGSADAFATDTLALAMARHGLELGLDAGLETDQRLFFYLPFEHSEDLDDQHTSVRLITALGNADYLDFAKKHCAIIEQFGRFPHRNAVLGRANRPGEEEALRQGAGW